LRIGEHPPAEQLGLTPGLHDLVHDHALLPGGEGFQCGGQFDVRRIGPPGLDEHAQGTPADRLGLQGDVLGQVGQLLAELPVQQGQLGLLNHAGLAAAAADGAHQLAVSLDEHGGPFLAGCGAAGLDYRGLHDGTPLAQFLLDGFENIRVAHGGCFPESVTCGRRCPPGTMLSGKQGPAPATPVRFFRRWFPEGRRLPAQWMLCKNIRAVKPAQTPAP